MNCSTVVFTARHHFGTRFHSLAHRLPAELDHRLDQIPIACLNDALFLSGLNQGIHRLGGLSGCSSTVAWSGT